MRLLDLFCGGGGASKGYSDAGFEVVGVDNKNQPHYPFEFHLGDALEFVREHGHEFDVIASSPPYQHYTALRHLQKGKEYPDLVAPTREALRATGKPFIIENVAGAPLQNTVMLCGTMFHLSTSCGAELRRHRWFELGGWELPCFFVPECEHGWILREGVTITGHSCPTNVKTIGVYGEGACMAGARTTSVYGDTPRDTAAENRKYKTVSVTGSTPQQNVERNKIRETFSIAEARRAMAIDWMPMSRLSQAIPPPYTKWIGLQLIEWLKENGLCSSE
jgi:DNA (cytosine-5)-methyltransferase 1